MGKFYKIKIITEITKKKQTNNRNSYTPQKCPSGRSVVCHTSRRHGRRTPKNDQTDDSTQVNHRVEAQTGTRSRSPRATGRTLTSSNGLSRHHQSISCVIKRCLTSPPGSTRATTNLSSSSRFNVPPDEPLTSVNSTTSVDSTVIDGVDSLTFNSHTQDHAYTTDQLTTQSCASHMIVTRAISRRAQPGFPHVNLMERAMDVKVKSY